jgi:hypothetical protein
MSDEGDPAAKYIVRARDQVVRVMGEDWFSARGDAFEIMVRPAIGLVGLVWNRGAPSQHAVLVLDDDDVRVLEVATVGADGEQQAVGWHRDETGARVANAFTSDRPPEEYMDLLKALFGH